MTTETPTNHVAWKPNKTPVSVSYNDIYYAEENGLSESRYVFLEQNQLPVRWADKEQFSIGEFGFGTGLNFLATCHLWLKTAKPGSKLFYTSCEIAPLGRQDIALALSVWPELEELKKEFLENYFGEMNSSQIIHLFDNKVTLRLLIGDALDVFSKEDGPFDAWFFDGFSPQKNPDMWRKELFKLASKLSSPGATFSTFAAAGFVQRNIQDAGFSVQKKPGYGRKREMICGSLVQ